MPDSLERLNAVLRGRYHVERVVGVGGMASVYEARDLLHPRRVAVKVLRSEVSARVAAERFLTEIRTTASLQHPHILPLFESGEAEGLLYYVMPFIEGESLRDRLERSGPMAIDEAVSIARALAGALHYAHGKGVVHRDVKPGNVMLSGGVPILADFGIALAVSSSGDVRLTSKRFTVSTPLYASPEQAAGEDDLDGRSDLYSLACVLYEMLVGEPPHQGMNAQRILAKRLTVPPTPVGAIRASVPGYIDAVLAQALQIRPEARFETAGDFAQALLDGARGVATGPKQWAPSGPVAPAATPLVGRRRERADLIERLDAATAGRGSLVLLGGEAGIGKTRLSEFVLDEARRRGCMCVVGRSYPVAGMPAFAPFIEQLEYTTSVIPPEALRAVLGDAAPDLARMMPAIRRQFPDIGPGIELPPDQFRHHLFHRYAEFTRRACEVAPLVALFDDLHWADEGSLLLLEFLAQQIHGLPLLAIATYRDDEEGMAEGFGAALGRLSRQHSAHRLSLRHLGEGEVAELVEAMGGSAAPPPLLNTIWGETEGNPFFVEEIFRHLRDEGRLFDAQGEWRTDLLVDELEVPEGVRLLLERRLDRVTSDCRAALTLAAVVGQRFAESVLECTGLMDPERLPEVLEEGERASLIEQWEGPRREVWYRFTHSLIRQVLVESLPRSRRQRAHLGIAAAFEAAYGARVDDYASDMAHHLHQAGPRASSERTVRFLKLAGDQALAASGYEEALSLYDRALSLDPDVPPAIAPQLLEGRVRALDGMGRWPDVIETGHRALDLYEALDDAEGLARLSRLVCDRLEWMAQYEEAARIGRRALAHPDSVASGERARLKCQLGIALDLTGEDGSRELIEEGLAEAESSGDEGAVLQARLALTIWYYHQGAYGKALAEAEEGWRLLADSSDESTRTDFLWLGSLMLGPVGRLDDLRKAIQQAREVGTERHEIGALLCASFGEITLEAMTSGDGRRAEELGLAVARDFAIAGDWAKLGLVHAGLGRLWYGDVEEAADLMEVDSAETPGSRLWGAQARAWRFRTAVYSGRVKQARRLFEDVEPWLFRVGRRAYPGDAFALHAVIDGLVVLGDTEVAAGLYPDAAASLELGIQGNWDLLWACTAGLAAACGNRWPEAETHFSAAMDQAGELPHIMGRLDTLRWSAWMLLRRAGPGDTERARALLDEAVDGYRGLHATVFAELAAGMLPSTPSGR